LKQHAFLLLPYAWLPHLGCTDRLWFPHALSSSPQVYFDHHATTIQRWWRGYYSRTRIHSYYQRKAFLSAVAQQNSSMRAAMAEAAAAAAVAQHEAAAAAALSCFEQKVCSSHHLTSTSAIPGIFSSPAAAASGGLPLVGGYTIEEHLWAACKAHVGTGTWVCRWGGKGSGLTQGGSCFRIMEGWRYELREWDMISAGGMHYVM
jgi:hypothetical protein